MASNLCKTVRWPEIEQELVMVAIVSSKVVAKALIERLLFSNLGRLEFSDLL